MLEQVTQIVFFKLEKESHFLIIKSNEFVLGGAVTGIGRKIKEKCPNCPVIGIDPVGSTMALPESLNSGPGFFEVEGIGHTWLPDCLGNFCAYSGFNISRNISESATYKFVYRSLSCRQVDKSWRQRNFQHGKEDNFGGRSISWYDYPRMPQDH